MVGKLYDIVIKNDYNLYIENINLFKEFYYRREEFFYYMDKDNRIIEIIKYMLISDNNEIDNYLHINILNDLIIKFKTINVCNNLLYKNGINVLINNMYNYNFIKEIMFDKNYINKLDRNSLNIVKKYINSSIDIEVLNIFINNLSNNFLSFEKEDILLMINTIENYNYDNMIVEGNNDEEYIICNFIDNYCHNYLEIKNICTNLGIRDDKLLNYLFYKNKKYNGVFYRIILNKINNDFLIKFFNYDLNEFKRIINNSNITIFTKNNLLQMLFNNLFKDKDYKYLFNIYDIEKDNKNKEKYINFILNDNPLLLNDQLIRYILKNNYENKYFLLNLNECIDELDINNNTLKLLNKKLKELKNNIGEEKLLTDEEIPLKYTLAFLNYRLRRDNYLEDRMIYYFKNFIRETLRENGIYAKVIFGKNLSKSGYYNEETNVIFINIDLIKKFIIEKNFDIFVTIFHEIRHAVQIKEIKSGEDSEIKNICLKDYILSEESSKYYKENYKLNQLEKDAKIFSLEVINIFIKDHFCDYYDKNYCKYKDKLLEYENNKDKKKIFNTLEICDGDIFDKIIVLRSELLDKYLINRKAKTRKK